MGCRGRVVHVGGPHTSLSSCRMLTFSPDTTLPLQEEALCVQVFSYTHQLHAQLLRTQLPHVLWRPQS